MKSIQAFSLCSFRVLERASDVFSNPVAASPRNSEPPRPMRQLSDFRFDLMGLRENAESIALYRGEPQERAQIYRRFEDGYSTTTSSSRSSAT
ncbi:hypothetical protein [Variovorax sp. OK605]|uniref:hypothetical protein n=1 Tax=Variovorax sp. OK605 TaxID=1855317 RepID=UPI000B844413|nr:hypothetical protein [Variovorax sp. OK605]